VTGEVTDPIRLLGRERELAVLRQIVRSGSRRVGRTLLVVGEPGIGKSALLRHVQAQAAAAGFTVLSGVFRINRA
jgi:predicted ATPase